MKKTHLLHALFLSKKILHWNDVIEKYREARRIGFHEFEQMRWMFFSFIKKNLPYAELP